VSTSPDAEAFLKPAGLSHPGVTYLSLNRPKTKNAISVNLLQVQHTPTAPPKVESLSFDWCSNSGTA